MVGVALVAVTGCEDDPSKDGVGSYFDENPISVSGGGSADAADMVLSPASTNLTSDGAVFTASVVGGTSPYSWSVNDVSKGSIIETGASSAVYQRAAAGDNVVICEDRRGARVFLTVTQP